MGPWGMGTGIKTNTQTIVTYLGRYITGTVSAVHVATRSYLACLDIVMARQDNFGIDHL